MTNNSYCVLELDYDEFNLLQTIFSQVLSLGQLTKEQSDKIFSLIEKSYSSAKQKGDKE